MAINGMWLNGKPTDQPPYTTRINKNIVFKEDSLVNEDGFTKLFDLPMKPIGQIELDNNDYVVFMTNNVDSAIYLIGDNVFKRIADLTELNFNTDRPIHGTFYLNNKKERIITWTDGTLKSINVDNPVYSQINSNNFEPVVNVAVAENGNLQAGSMQIIIRLIRTDGSTTNWIKKSNPVYISTAKGIESTRITNKSLNVIITNLDLNYKKVEIGFIYGAKGSKKVYIVKQVNIFGSSLYTSITGNEVLSEITLSDVIIDNINYKNIDHITTVEDSLIGVGIKLYEEPILDTSSITLNWVSRKNTTDNTTFAHDEIYAYYIRLKWSWGYGRWHFIQGRNAENNEEQQDGDFKYFVLHDTCSVISNDNTTVVGKFSYWKNENDGNKLFKFPSMNWMRKNVYDGDYGSKYLDKLDIKANVNLNNFTDQNGNHPESYEIGYAERTNSRVVDQTLALPNFKSQTQLVSTGGNWDLGDITVRDDLFIRTYPFALLRDKQQPLINYIRREYLVSGNTHLLWLIKNSNFAYSGTTDFTELPTFNDILSVPYKIDEVKYIIGNTVTTNYNNVYLEDFYSIKLKTPSNLFEGVHHFNTVLGLPSETNFVEQCSLISLLNIQTNYYTDPYNTQIINCGYSTNNIFGGGDAFLNNTALVTYGVEHNKYTSDLTQFVDNPDTFNYKENGMITNKRYLFESKLNLNLRYVNPQFEYATTFEGKWYEYAKLIQKDISPNDLINGYDIDMNDHNSIAFTDIYNPNKAYRYDYPFLVVQSDPLNKEADNDINTWRTFRIANTYEITREKGKVINVVNTKDGLFIHFQNSLYQTRPRGQLQTNDVTEVQLGFGNLFQYPPVPIVHSKLGELGTKHKWSCLLSTAGYSFYDEDKGQWFIVGEGLQIITEGMTNFFLKNKECLGTNPYTGYGISSFYDDKYNRLVITKKNQLPKNKSKYKGRWNPDGNYVAGDIVFKDGKYKKFV